MPVRRFIDELAIWRPKFSRRAARRWQAQPAISIFSAWRSARSKYVRRYRVDYAVMEKTDKAVVVPAKFDWSDVGSWSALWTSQEGAGNVVIGDAVMEDDLGLLRARRRATASRRWVDDLVIATRRTSCW